MIVKGVVERGAGRGKSDFVPTVNLMLDENPKGLDFGIYVCKIQVRDMKYSGVLHYGNRSSIDGLDTFEVNIFDFDEDIYGEQVEVEVLEKIRDIIKFDSVNELSIQIKKDILEAKTRLTMADETIH